MITYWYTVIVVCGQCRDVDEFENTYLADWPYDIFDLNSVVPMPPEIAYGTEAAQIAWQMENWGCSSNAYLLEDADDDPMEDWECARNACTFEDGDDHHLSFDFRTHDGPPEKVFEAMARRFPRLAFTIYSQDLKKDARTLSGHYLEDGRIIAVHRVTDLGAEIRERIRPDMTDQEKRQLAEWCASKKILLPAGVWLEAIECEKGEAQNFRPDKVQLH